MNRTFHNCSHGNHDKLISLKTFLNSIVSDRWIYLVVRVTNQYYVPKL